MLRGSEGGEEEEESKNKRSPWYQFWCVFKRVWSRASISYGIVVAETDNLIVCALPKNHLVFSSALVPPHTRAVRFLSSCLSSLDIRVVRISASAAAGSGRRGRLENYSSDSMRACVSYRRRSDCCTDDTSRIGREWSGDGHEGFGNLNIHFTEYHRCQSLQMDMDGKQFNVFHIDKTQDRQANYTRRNMIAILHVDVGNEEGKGRSRLNR